ncbi:MAG: hypothetical protein ACT4O0_10175 [Pseudonocardia sp.]
MANQLDRAASAIDVALAEAASPAVVALARAWLAQLRNRQKEPGEAARHAAAYPEVAGDAEQDGLERAVTRLTGPAPAG